MHLSTLWTKRTAWTLAIVLAVSAPIEAEKQPVEGSDMKTSVAEPTVGQANHLINETSPYLLQHARNPVEWYPWGEEALQRARREDKPIFLSIGYSACHWCHVMAHESFEDEEVAAILKEHFISIKVDREERPDLDEIYMNAARIQTGGGGWPLSIFLTPKLQPFYSGTYFPPDDAYGRPGFKSLLKTLAEAWETKRAKIDESAGRLTEMIRESMSVSPSEGEALSSELIKNAVYRLEQTFDFAQGGFGQAPKFPPSATLELLMRQYAHTGEKRILDMVTLTLDKMAYGGMYDQLGGGFHRYSTDALWLVPHFEKMLYDNAQLCQVYLDAYQLTGKPLYKRIASEILDYELRDMRDELGGFHSTEDADSEGEEGKFYLWSHEEIMSILGEKDGKIFAAYYNLKSGGNFSSREEYHANLNILHVPREHQAVAAELDLSIDELETRLEPMRAKLMTVRDKRVHPGLDDKVLTDWNGLIISAFARGYQVLGDPRYLEGGQGAADFVLKHMLKDGQLLHTHRKGESRLPAYLDDYAFMVVGLLDLYEASFDTRWLAEADRLTAQMIEKFWDDEARTFYFTSDAHKNLLVRSREATDSAVPSGSSMAALSMLRLARLLDKKDIYAKAQASLEAQQSYMARAPRAMIKMLCATDLLLHPPREIALVGAPEAQDFRALLTAVHSRYLPNKIMAAFNPLSPDASSRQEMIPLLKARTALGGQATAYVCKDFTCKLPVTSAENLLGQLE